MNNSLYYSFFLPPERQQKDKLRSNKKSPSKTEAFKKRIISLSTLPKSYQFLLEASLKYRRTNKSRQSLHPS